MTPTTKETCLILFWAALFLIAMALAGLLIGAGLAVWVG